MNKLEFVHCKPSTCIICMLFISTIFASIQFKIESRRGFCIAEDIKTPDDNFEKLWEVLRVIPNGKKL